MPPENRGCLASLFLALGKAVLWLIALVYAAWAFGALWFDCPVVPRIAAQVFGAVVLLLFLSLRGFWRSYAACVLAASGVLAWWLTLQPRSDRDWQPDVAETAWAEIKGDEVTIHNVRNCDYQTPTQYTPRWETRTVRLSQMTGIDFAITYWGSPYMAHPIASFQFAGAPPVCFSIETRKEAGESYSAIGGFYRQFELIYVVADEADVLRLRTNFRKNEDVYLYRLNVTPEKARERFMDYVTTLNQLHVKPRWYNAATANCTTAIRTQHAASERAPWDWRMLVNGKGDEMMYERGALASDGLPFADLKPRAKINSAAHIGDVSAFSVRIRQNRPGFASGAAAKP